VMDKACLDVQFSLWTNYNMGIDSTGPSS